jgi:hypothetical protein
MSMTRYLILMISMEMVIQLWIYTLDSWPSLLLGRTSLSDLLVFSSSP